MTGRSFYRIDLSGKLPGAHVAPWLEHLRGPNGLDLSRLGLLFD